MPGPASTVRSKSDPPALLLNLSGPPLSRDAKQTHCSPIRGLHAWAHLAPASSPLHTLLLTPCLSLSYLLSPQGTSAHYSRLCSNSAFFTRTFQAPPPPSPSRGRGDRLLSFLILLISLKPFKALATEYIMLGRLSSNHSVRSLRVGVQVGHPCNPRARMVFPSSFIQQMLVEGPLCTRLHERLRGNSCG